MFRIELPGTQYPDEILRDIMSRFTPAHWAILQDLCCEITEYNLRLLPKNEIEPKPLSKLQEGVTLAPQYFRVHIGFLQGATAIDIIQDPRDQRKRPAMITNNGYRMVELQLQDQGIL
jgi:hypothetical protein